METTLITIDWRHPHRNTYHREAAMSLPDLVREMRLAQKAYQANGTRKNKNRRAVLERLVDRRISNG